MINITFLNLKLFTFTEWLNALMCIKAKCLLMLLLNESELSQFKYCTQAKLQMIAVE